MTFKESCAKSLHYTTVAKIGTCNETRTHTEECLRLVPLPLGYTRITTGAQGETRTHRLLFLCLLTRHLTVTVRAEKA